MSRNPITHLQWTLYCGPGQGQGQAGGAQCPWQGRWLGSRRPGFLLPVPANPLLAHKDPASLVQAGLCSPSNLHALTAQDLP